MPVAPDAAKASSAIDADEFEPQALSKSSVIPVGGVYVPAPPPIAPQSSRSSEDAGDTDGATWDVEFDADWEPVAPSTGVAVCPRRT